MMRVRGNQTEGQTKSGLYIQPQMEVGEVDDKYEREANNVADKIMRMPEVNQMPKMNAYNEDVQLMKLDEDPIKMDNSTEGKIQKMSEGNNGMMTAPQNVERGIVSSKGSGQPLPESTEADLSQKMNTDLSNVKVHSDSNSAQMNEEIGAKAFTHGNDIYFNRGQYNPQSNEGQHLLVHELTHTVQQSDQIRRSPGEFDEPAKNKDARYLYVRKIPTFNKIKQYMLEADVKFEGDPTPSNIVKKTNPNDNTQIELYQGIISTTTATPPEVVKLLDAIMPAGGELLIINHDEFADRFKALSDAFKVLHPNTVSALRAFAVNDQDALFVDNKASCIETMNKSLQNLYGRSTLNKDTDLKDQAFESIKVMQDKGLAGENLHAGLKYQGTGDFEITETNVSWDPKTFSQTLIDFVKDKEDGYYLFAVSLFNGYHSLIINVKKTGTKYVFGWKDQHSEESGGSGKNLGATELTASELDKKAIGYGVGRFYWRVKEVYEDETGIWPSSFSDIKGKERTKRIIAEQKLNVLDDLKPENTLITPLKP